MTNNENKEKYLIQNPNPKIPTILTTAPTKALAKQIEEELKKGENCIQTIIPQP